VLVFEIFRATKLIRWSRFEVDCKCESSGSATCSATATVSKDFRQGVVAVMDDCTSTYSTLYAVLLAVLILDIVFTVVELGLDVSIGCFLAETKAVKGCARVTAIVFFIVFGSMLLATSALAPTKLVCNEGGRLAAAVPGCSLTDKWYVNWLDPDLVQLVCCEGTTKIRNERF
jgi:hypothetical protein